MIPPRPGMGAMPPSQQIPPTGPQPGGMPSPPQGPMPGGGMDAQQKPTLAGQVKDPMLRQIKSGIEQQVPPELRDDYNSIVMSGLSIITSEQLGEKFLTFMQQASQAPPEQKPKVYGYVIANGIGTIYKETMADQPEERQQEFMQASTLAGLTLMTHLLEYAEAVDGQPVDQAIISETAKSVSENVFKLWGVGPEDVRNAVEGGVVDRSQGGGMQKPGGGMPQPGGGMPQPGGGLAQFGGGGPPPMAR